MFYGLVKKMLLAARGNQLGRGVGHAHAVVDHRTRLVGVEQLNRSASRHGLAFAEGLASSSLLGLVAGALTTESLFARQLPAQGSIEGNVVTGLLIGVDHDGIDPGGRNAHLPGLERAGYVRITGRSKDVIIRGGENIPVVEIEALLYRHPAIAMAAIVAYPDERLGERACAVVVPRPGQTLDLPSIVEFLKSQKVAVQYIPERLIARDALPSTPSGKIQKFRLRDDQI